MSTTLEHVAGTDSTWLFPLITLDNEGYQAALADDPDTPIEDFQTPTDLTGVNYFYFEIFEADGTTSMIRKDNDPAGINAGVTFRAPLTAGLVEVRMEHADLIASTPGDRLPYVAKLRQDPLGSDDRSRPSAGAIKIVAQKLVVAP